MNRQRSILAGVLAVDLGAVTIDRVFLSPGSAPASAEASSAEVAPATPTGAPTPASAASPNRSIGVGSTSGNAAASCRCDAVVMWRLVDWSKRRSRKEDQQSTHFKVSISPTH